MTVNEAINRLQAIQPEHGHKDIRLAYPRPNYPKDKPFPWSETDGCRMTVTPGFVVLSDAIIQPHLLADEKAKGNPEIRA